MPTFQEQFQQYLSNSYYPNDPTLNQGGEPNVVEPINTFDVSPELKKKLKKQRKTISPIRQYENDTLQFDETTGTGQFDFSDPFKLFNIAAQGITGFANANNDAKNRRLEEQMYLQSLIPKPSFNYNEDGLNNIPMYKGGGKKESKQAAAWRILRDGKANGKKLTDKQKKFFLAMGRAKFPDGGINTTNIDPGWGNPKYGPVLPNFGGDPGWGDPKYGPDLPEFYGDPGWGNPAFYPRQQQINMNGQWVPQAILDYKALQSNSISNSKGTTNLGWNMINDWAQKAFKNPRYMQSAIAEENDNDWHHNVDDIPFPGYGMTPLDPKNSKYFQDEAFIGPPNYPANLQGVSNPQWSFRPVRVDYNQKYIPYKQYPNPTAPVRQHKLKKEVTTVDNIINKVLDIGSTEPQVQPITGQKIFLDPNNPTMAAPQNDIWNNPNGSDQLPVEPYERKGTGDVKSWFATGGYNEGEEIDLTEEQIKEMQKAGFRFEIL